MAVKHPIQYEIPVSGGFGAVMHHLTSGGGVVTFPHSENANGPITISSILLCNIGAAAKTFGVQVGAVGFTPGTAYEIYAPGTPATIAAYDTVEIVDKPFCIPDGYDLYMIAETTSFLNAWITYSV
jgi:hypothetical protein